MNYADVENFNVDETAPLIYMIHIDKGETRDLFIGSAARGSDLPRQGQLWAAESLLQSDPPYPDWFFRCERVHFAMAEASLLDHPIKLLLLGNTLLSQLETKRRKLEQTMRPSLNVCLPDETSSMIARLRMLRFKALDDFRKAESPKALRAQVPHRWNAACEGYADMKSISVKEAEQRLKRKFAIF
ncbi:MAG: hypothetical protein R8G34_16870 [Paracoccaceae bacterium]|nr:hypothetical protein [Paracoccaceae bacterium]